MPLSSTIQISKAGGLLSEDVLLRNLANKQEKRGGFSELYAVSYSSPKNALKFLELHTYIFTVYCFIILLLSDIYWAIIIRSVLYM